MSFERYVTSFVPTRSGREVLDLTILERGVLFSANPTLPPSFYNYYFNRIGLHTAPTPHPPKTLYAVLSSHIRHALAPDFIAIVRVKWPPTSLVTPASLWSTSVKPAHWFIKPASCTEAINKHVPRTRAWLTALAHCWQQCLFQAIAFLLSRFVRWFIFWRGFLRRLKLMEMYQLGRFFFLTSTEQSVQLKSVVRNWPRASEFAAVTKKEVLLIHYFLIKIPECWKSLKPPFYLFIYCKTIYHKCHYLAVGPTTNNQLMEKVY